MQENILLSYTEYLKKEERAKSTIQKYLQVAEKFIIFLRNKSLNRTEILSYKEQLKQRYCPATLNNMICALNCFFVFLNREDLKLKPLKIQKQLFLREEKELTKEEYERLLMAAGKNFRVYLLLQTICSTGIRVSELVFITADAVRNKTAYIRNKGKSRIAELPTLEYIVNADAKSCTITGIGNFAGENLIIPSVLDGYAVSAIGEEAFYGQTGLKSVSIANTVTSIGKEAFYYCTGLTSVNLGNGLKTLGDSAFGYCSSLTNISLNEGLKSIGIGVFRDCTALTGIEIPDSVTVFGVTENGALADGIFYNCKALSFAVIGNSVTNIPNYMFYGCQSLSSVMLPGGVTTIGISAFEGCGSLQKIDLPGSVTTIVTA